MSRNHNHVFRASIVETPLWFVIIVSGMVSGTPNVCSSGPCHNGGECIDLSSPSGIKKFECACMEGYEGITCQQRINPCAAEPCENEGQCVPRVGVNYHCVCTKKFHGKNCELRKSPEACETKPCHPNGVCVPTNEGFICECNQGYHGPRCTQKDAKDVEVIEKEVVVESKSSVALIFLIVIVVLIILTLLFTAIHCLRVFNRRSSLKAAQDRRVLAGEEAGELPGWFETSNAMCADFLCCKAQQNHTEDVQGVIVPVREYNSMVLNEQVSAALVGSKRGTHSLGKVNGVSASQAQGRHPYASEHINAATASRAQLSHASGQTNDAKSSMGQFLFTPGKTSGGASYTHGHISGVTTPRETASYAPGHISGVSTPREMASYAPGHISGVTTPREMASYAPEHISGVTTPREMVSYAPGHISGVSTPREMVSYAPGHISGVSTPREMASYTPGQMSGVYTPDGGVSYGPGQISGVFTPHETVPFVPGHVNGGSTTHGTVSFVPGQMSDASTPHGTPCCGARGQSNIPSILQTRDPSLSAERLTGGPTSHSYNRGQASGVSTPQARRSPHTSGHNLSNLSTLQTRGSHPPGTRRNSGRSKSQIQSGHAPNSDRRSNGKSTFRCDRYYNKQNNKPTVPDDVPDEHTLYASDSPSKHPCIHLHSRPMDGAMRDDKSNQQAGGNLNYCDDVCEIEDRCYPGQGENSFPSDCESESRYSIDAFSSGGFKDHSDEELNEETDIPQRHGGDGGTNISYRPTARGDEINKMYREGPGYPDNKQSTRRFPPSRESDPPKTHRAGSQKSRHKNKPSVLWSPEEFWHDFQEMRTRCGLPPTPKGDRDDRLRRLTSKYWTGMSNAMGVKDTRSHDGQYRFESPGNPRDHRSFFYSDSKAFRDRHKSDSANTTSQGVDERKTKTEKKKRGKKTYRIVKRTFLDPNRDDDDTSDVYDNENSNNDTDTDFETEDDKDEDDDVKIYRHGGYSPLVPIRRGSIVSSNRSQSRKEDDGYGSPGRLSESDAGGRARDPQSLHARFPSSKKFVHDLIAGYNSNGPGTEDEDDSRVMITRERKTKKDNNQKEYTNISGNRSQRMSQVARRRGTTDEEEGDEEEEDEDEDDQNSIRGRYSITRQVVRQSKTPAPIIDPKAKRNRHDVINPDGQSSTRGDKKKMKRGEILAASRKSLQQLEDQRRSVVAPIKALSPAPIMVETKPASPKPKGILKNKNNRAYPRSSYNTNNNRLDIGADRRAKNRTYSYRYHNI